MKRILQKIENDLRGWLYDSIISEIDKDPKEIRLKFQQLVSDCFIKYGFPLDIYRDLACLTAIKVDSFGTKITLLYSPSVISYCERNNFHPTRKGLPAEFPKNETSPTPWKEASLNEPVKPPIFSEQFGEYSLKELELAQRDPAVLLFYFADHLTTVGGK